MRTDLVGNAERSARPVELVVKTLVVLGLTKIRQDVAVGPARATGGLRPRVVVAGIASRIDHRVDRASSPEDAPLRIGDRALVCAPLRGRFVAPGQRTG